MTPEASRMHAVEELRTARMILRRISREDHDDLARMHRDPRVMATLGGARSEEFMRERLEHHIAIWERDGFGWWVLREPGTERLIGRGGLRKLEVEGRPEVELGYGLVAEFWGRGLATELAIESVRVGFEVLGVPDLICFTMPTNRASQRVMEKAGFRYERDGTWADLPHVFYRLTANEWRKGGCAAPR
jgi:RimJ/RimL family protein N-acetyltransferase